MGDMEWAERATRKALALEPDNALFQNNLDELLRQKAEASP